MGRLRGSRPYDRKSKWQHFARQKEGMNMCKEQFDITGMTCSACSARVEQCVAKLPGVAEVSVNLLKNSMAVSYDEEAMRTDTIVAAVENAGYGAILKASARSGKETKPEVSTAQTEYKAMKQRLFLSALFTVPLFYISMGHMMLRLWREPMWALPSERAPMWPSNRRTSY